jgi:hypothetical protein
LFIPQAIYEHGELWWNDIDKGNSDSSTKAFWQFYQQSRLVAQQVELAKEMNMPFEVSFFMLKRVI